MAIKIPVYESQVAAPSSSGAKQLQNHDTGQAAVQFGGDLQQFARVREDKIQKNKIIEAESALKKQSLEFYLDAEKNRQGKAALEDPENERDAVYDDYDRFGSEAVDKALQGISPQYHTLAKQRLNGVADGWRTKVAIYQSQQEQVHRKNVMGERINATETELYATMERGGDQVDVNAALTEIKEFLKEGSGGKSIENEMIAFEAQVVKDSILAASASDAHRAQELLETDNLREKLAPSMIKTLEATVEKDRIDQDSQEILQAMNTQAFDYETRLDIAKDITDKDVRDVVFSEIQRQEQVVKAQEIEDQTNLMTSYYDRIMNKGEEVSIIDVRKDTVLTFDQREKVVNWLKGDGEGFGKLGDQNRWLAWTQAQDNIISGRWNKTDVRNAVLAGELDIRDAKSVEGDYESFITSGGKTYSDLDLLFQAKYPSIHKNQGRRAQVMYGAMQYVKELRTKEARNPTGEEVEKFLLWSAKGIVETSFFGREPEAVNRAESIYPMIDDPQGKLSATGSEQRVSLIEATVLDHRLNPDNAGRKFPKTYYDAKRNWYVLGEPETPDGKVYIKGPDGRIGAVDKEKWVKSGEQL